MISRKHIVFGFVDIEVKWMNYREALEYIHSTAKFGSVLGLERIKKLMEILGDPQEKLNIIHVGGTNGKGSTSSFISHILTQSGYKTGLFTSPYLESFCERIKIDSKDIGKDELAKSASAVKKAIDTLLDMGYDHPTEFEIVTAIAFYYYCEKEVDFVVLEVGLGGRYDATNIIEKPLVSVITPIDMDHMDMLGDTIEKIAYEKAGIIKPKMPVIVYPQSKEAMEVIKRVAAEKDSKLIVADIKSNVKKSDLSAQVFDCTVDGHRFEDMKIKLIGRHQVNNAIVALNVVWELSKTFGYFIGKDCMYKGLERTVWPGRLELLKKEPNIIIDGAHNLHGAKALSSFMKDNFKRERTILVLGMLRDKEVDKVIRELVPLAETIICTSPENPRAMDSSELSSIIRKEFKNVHIIASNNSIRKSIHEAVNIAKDDSSIIIAGSLYMIGSVRSIILNGK